MQHSLREHGSRLLTAVSPMLIFGCYGQFFTKFIGPN
jgi:hypothetical protein